jgi:hypothetical protein
VPHEVADSHATHSPSAKASSEPSVPGADRTV